MGKLKPLNIYSLVCPIAYLYQSDEWPSLVFYDYDVTKVCSVDRLPITQSQNRTNHNTLTIPNFCTFEI